MIRTSGSTRVRVLPLVSFLPYLVVGGVHLIALATTTGPIVLVSKALLMPALAAAVAVSGGLGSRRLTVWLIAAIGLSWVGDIALNVPGDLGFVVGLGGFLLAHVAYLVLFVRLTGLRRPRAVALVYAVWFVVFLAVLAPSLGVFLAPVVIYGVVLGAMAVAALRLGVLVALGGALFVVSDTVLAIMRFLPDAALPAHDLIVMTTYIAAQGLIAWGLLRRFGAGTTAHPIASRGRRAPAMDR